MKKTISILLLVCMLFITACGAQSTVLLPFLDESADGSYDYGGVEIVISSEHNTEGSENYWSVVLKHDTTTIFGEAVLSQIAKVEEDLGVDIVLHTDEGGVDEVRMKVMSGTYVADVVNYISFGAMQNFALGGLLYPMTDFEHIDLTQAWKYGGANVLEGAMINSVPYAVMPVAWPHWEPTGISSIIYNMDMIEDYSMTDPHEFWENENWYWTTFEDTYLKPDFGLKEEEWVLSASEYMFWYGLAYSNDVRYVYANANGEYAVNPKPQAEIEALQTGADWYGNYRDKIKLNSDYWSFDDYRQGVSAFTITYATNASNSGIDVRSGLMPFPCGPSTKYGTWCQAFDRIDGFGISINSKEPEISAHVISELFEPLDEYLNMTLEEYYREMMFNSEIDAEIYQELIKDVRYDYTFSGGSDLMRSINNNFSGAIKAGKSANETADTYASQILSVMTAHALPNFEYMNKNFYSQLDGE